MFREALTSGTEGSFAIEKVRKVSVCAPLSFGLSTCCLSPLHHS